MPTTSRTPTASDNAPCGSTPALPTTERQPPSRDKPSHKRSTKWELGTRDDTCIYSGRPLASAPQNRYASLPKAAELPSPTKRPPQAQILFPPDATIPPSRGKALQADWREPPKSRLRSARGSRRDNATRPSVRCCYTQPPTSRRPPPSAAGRSTLAEKTKRATPEVAPIPSDARSRLCSRKAPSLLPTAPKGAQS